MPYVKALDETDLYYRDWGFGLPVGLIHGWQLNGDMWERQAEFLAAHGLRVITYDRRGFGRSGQSWSGYDYDTFASDLNQVMEYLNLQEAVLVGFSMGGGEVARYVGRYGTRRVSKTVLMGFITPFLLKTDDNPDGIDAEMFEEIEESIREDRPAFLKDFAQKFYGRSVLSHPVSDSILDWTQIMALTSTLRPTLAAANAWSSTDFRDDLGAITVPTLVIHGTSDATVPIEKSAQLTVNLLPNGVLSEYGGEPHGRFITASDRLNEELLAFIEGRPPTTIPVSELGLAGDLPLGEAVMP